MTNILDDIISDFRNKADKHRVAAEKFDVAADKIQDAHILSKELKMTTTEKTNAISVKFANKLNPQLGEGNLFYSPFSIQVALGMALAGAKGETAEQLASVIEAPTDPQEQKDFFKNLAESGTATNDQYELTTDNALWIQANLKLTDGFAENIKENFKGNFIEVDYKTAPDEAVQKINAHIKEATKDKIPEILTRSDVNDATRLVLTNAIYFKGKWANKFSKEKTRDLDFHSSEGAKKVPTMYQSSKLQYGDVAFYFGDGLAKRMQVGEVPSVAANDVVSFQALDLRYKGGDLSMLILLPKANSEGAFNTTGIDENLEFSYQVALASLSVEKVNVHLPKFKVETEYKLKDTLIEMGAKLAFSDAADFSGITIQEGGLKIDKVIHKAFVECDEEGTEAAAATAVTAVLKCASFSPEIIYDFKADHPFVFFIRNLKTNEVLFCGRVESP